MTSTNPNDTRRRHPWMLALIAATLLASGLGAGLAIANNRSDTAAPTSATAQLANVNDACKSWTMSTTTAANTANWCTDMTAWMNTEITAGHAMGSMMWDNPDRLLNSCQSWMQTQRLAPPTTTWCDDMVSWMRQHMTSDWNGMMNGSMMGR